MPRQDRLAADLDRGFAALEAGEIEDAAAALERCQRIDRKNAEVVTLGAAVADARGDVEDALKQYRLLVELMPDDPMPRICVARLELRDLHDPDAALDTLDAAFDFIDDEADLIEAVLIRTEALIINDDLEAARATLGELATSVIEDGELALELAELALAAGDPSSAARWADVAVAMPELRTDALHLTGRIFEVTGDRARMIETWQQVRALDAAAPPGPVSISDDEIERIALDTLAELPPVVRKRLERVPILIDKLPSAELVADGIDPRVLGLFQGSPLTEDGELAATVTTILLFRTNLERSASDLDHLAEEVRVTVLHETAHYFGLDEDDLENLGLD